MHAGEHFPGMRTRVDPSKDVGDDAVLIHDIGDAARKTSPPSTIGWAQDMARIAQEREAEAGVVGKGFIVFDRIKAGPENLYVALREGVIEGEEPAPFGGSPPGVGFGIKPQDHLFPTEICQADAGAIMRRRGKIRRRGPDCKHLRPPQDQAKPMFEQCKKRHTFPYDELRRCWRLSALSNRALARFTTGTSTTLPSNDVDPFPARSASSKAATTRLACSRSAGDGENVALMMSSWAG